MKIAICDDEYDYRKFLSDLISFYCMEHRITYSIIEFDSGNALLQSKEHFDIIFLDIEMDGQDGIETAKEMNKQNQMSLVFIVTAYQKYLDDAMDLNVFRYIDKPVNQRRIFAGLDKAIEFLNHNNITFQTRDDGFITIRMSDIIYVEVINKKVYVITEHKKYITREKMEYFKNELSATYFIIPHNSYIVNLNYIIQFKRDRIQMTNKEIISIAPKRQAIIRKKFMNFMGENNGSLSDDF